MHARRAGGASEANAPHCPYLQTIADNPNPVEQRVWIRGSRDNPGEPAPPHLLVILSSSEPKRFTKGAERLELADAIIDPENPLTARVIVNLVWQWHFGKGLVRTPRTSVSKATCLPIPNSLIFWLRVSWRGRLVYQKIKS
jgi:hypothetical protein